jgi:WhiB family transcriptional regulator, redox-sensing transcriptional regulator
MLAVNSRSVCWQQAAACRSADPELFFPVSSGGSAREQEERAKAVCRMCAVRRQCLQYALAMKEPYGVWGGMTEVERRRAPRSGRYDGNFSDPGGCLRTAGSPFRGA